jgi:hypothetical protein
MVGDSLVHDNEECGQAYAYQSHHGQVLMSVWADPKFLGAGYPIPLFRREEADCPTFSRYDC